VRKKGDSGNGQVVSVRCSTRAWNIFLCSDSFTSTWAGSEKESSKGDNVKLNDDSKRMVLLGHVGRLRNSAPDVRRIAIQSISKVAGPRELLLQLLLHERVGLEPLVLNDFDLVQVVWIFRNYPTGRTSS